MRRWFSIPRAVVHAGVLGAVVVTILEVTSVAAAGVGVAAQSPYVPRTETQRIVAYFGKTHLPGWLPHGYVYVRWEPIAGSADAFGEYLVLSFGNHGRLLRWTVDVPQDSQEYSHDDCSAHPSGQVLRVGGKRIVYHGGAVGQTATLCISKNTAVTVWNAYSVSKATLGRVAASAISVG